MKHTIPTQDKKAYLLDRYSERKEPEHKLLHRLSKWSTATGVAISSRCRGTNILAQALQSRIR